MRILYLLLMFTFLSLFISGCNITPRNEYIEGTSLSLGLYLPYNGQIYGIQALNYLSGKRIIANTNQFPKIKSEHIITNSSFFCFELNEINKTEINK